MLVTWTSFYIPICVIELISHIVDHTVDAIQLIYHSLVFQLYRLVFSNSKITHV